MSVTPTAINFVLCTAQSNVSPLSGPGPGPGSWSLPEEGMTSTKKVLVAVFVAIWVGVVIFAPDAPHDPAWTSKQASEALTEASNEFCREIYVKGECPRVGETAKNRIIRTVIFSANEAPPLQTVASVLEEKGWVLTDKSDARNTVFCRGDYRAAYTTSAERVWVEFSSGESVCLK